MGEPLKNTADFPAAREIFNRLWRGEVGWNETGEEGEFEIVLGDDAYFVILSTFEAERRSGESNLEYQARVAVEVGEWGVPYFGIYEGSRKDFDEADGSERLLVGFGHFFETITEERSGARTGRLKVLLENGPVADKKKEKRAGIETIARIAGEEWRKAHVDDLRTATFYLEWEKPIAR